MSLPGRTRSPKFDPKAYPVGRRKRKEPARVLIKISNPPGSGSNRYRTVARRPRRNRGPDPGKQTKSAIAARREFRDNLPIPPSY